MFGHFIYPHVQCCSLVLKKGSGHSGLVHEYVVLVYRVALYQPLIHINLDFMLCILICASATV